MHSKNSRLLTKNGGGIVLTKGWAQSLLSRMGFVKRKACSKAEVTVESSKEVNIGCIHKLLLLSMKSLLT